MPPISKQSMSPEQRLKKSKMHEEFLKKQGIEYPIEITEELNEKMSILENIIDEGFTMTDKNDSSYKETKELYDNFQEIKNKINNGKISGNDISKIRSMVSYRTNFDMQMSVVYSLYPILENQIEKQVKKEDAKEMLTDEEIDDITVDTVSDLKNCVNPEN